MAEDVPSFNHVYHQECYYISVFTLVAGLPPPPKRARLEAHASFATVEEVTSGGFQLVKDDEDFQEAFKAFEEVKMTQCPYKCRLCLTTFPGSLEFWSHFLKPHGCQGRDAKTYLKLFPGPEAACLEEKLDICKICDKSVMQDRGKMMLHLKNHHGYSLQRYFYTFYWHDMPDASTVSEGRVDSVDEASPMDLKEQLEPSDVSSTSEYNVESVNETVQEDEKELLDLGEITMIESESCTNHLLERLEELDEQDAALLASTELPHDHPLKILSYPPIKSAYDQCVFLCAVCDTCFSGKMEALLHIYTRHCLTSLQYMKKFGSLLVMENLVSCRLCDNELLGDSLVLSRHLSRVHNINLLQYHQLISGDESYSDLRLYSCQECHQHHTTQSQSLKSHVKSEHGMSMKKYRAKYGKEPFFKTTFRCIICQKTIRSSKSVRTHVKRHNIGFREHKFLMWSCLKNPTAKIVTKLAVSKKKPEDSQHATAPQAQEYQDCTSKNTEVSENQGLSLPSISVKLKSTTITPVQPLNVGRLMDSQVIGASAAEEDQDCTSKSTEASENQGLSVPSISAKLKSTTITPVQPLNVGRPIDSQVIGASAAEEDQHCSSENMEIKRNKAFSSLLSPAKFKSISHASEGLRRPMDSRLTIVPQAQELQRCDDKNIEVRRDEQLSELYTSAKFKSTSSAAVNASNLGFPEDSQHTTATQAEHQQRCTSENTEPREA